ncbi:MAG TPA: hypothetical protein VL442_18565 [Mucilaginibacter sp.]|jgi:hypothetical protein|nr:hypothetical protein [Mucilaginibacter sp.]
MLLPDGTSLAMLEKLVNDVIQQLQNAATTIEGNGSIVIGGATSQLSALLNQLKSMIGEDFTKPINQLSREIRNTSNQLFSAVNRINMILKNQQACLLVNVQVFLASITTVISGLKSGIPFIDNTTPRIDYFQFDGHTPSVVPKNGGRISIVGFDLWHDEKYPPEVKLFNEARNKVILDNIKPEKGQNVNSFSFILSPEFIAKNHGQNLQLQVISKEKHWLDLFGPKVLGTFFMPICIPETAFAKFKISAHLQYQTEVDVVETLDFRRFGMGNDSCEDRKNYSHTEAWQLPAGGQILSVVTKDPDVRNQVNVQFSFAGSTITAAGWLDTATCFCPPIGGCHLFHDTHWFASAAPQISYKKTGEKIVDVTSDTIEMNNNSVDFKLNFKKDSNDNVADIFWFDVILDNGNAQKTIFSSPKINTDTFSTNINGLFLDAKYTGQVVNGNSELAVNITLPGCGF